MTKAKTKVRSRRAKRRQTKRPYSDRLRVLADHIDSGKVVVTRFSELTSEGQYQDTERRTLHISVELPEGSTVREFC